MKPLLPCPSCDRHVRFDTPDCPFCAAPLPEVPAQAPYLKPAGRLGRAAVLAFRTMVIGAAGVGCGASTGPDLPDAEMIAEDGGAPAADGGAVDAGPGEFDAGFDAGGAIALYGGPMPADAGFDSGLGPAPAYGTPAPIEDAGVDSGGVGNLYGAPPG